MHMAIRRYKVIPGAMEQITQQVTTGFVPIISGTPGYVGYYLIDTGNDTLVTVSIFQDQAGTEESTRRAADFVRANMANLVDGPPEVSMGTVRVKNP